MVGGGDGQVTRREPTKNRLDRAPWRRAGHTTRPPVRANRPDRWAQRNGSPSLRPAGL